MKIQFLFNFNYLTLSIDTVYNLFYVKCAGNNSIRLNNNGSIIYSTCSIFDEDNHENDVNDSRGNNDNRNKENCDNAEHLRTTSPKEKLQGKNILSLE